MFFIITAASLPCSHKVIWKFGKIIVSYYQKPILRRSCRLRAAELSENSIAGLEPHEYAISREIDESQSHLLDIDVRECDGEDIKYDGVFANEIDSRQYGAWELHGRDIHAIELTG